MADTYYKFLNPGRVAPFSGYKYPKIGIWTPTVDLVVKCRSGYHFCREEHLLDWIEAELYEVEVGDLHEFGDKCATNKIRLARHLDGLNERTWRLLAADYAERVLPIYEKAYHNDDRAWLCIECARLYANGLATGGELAAAREAAWSAVQGAAVGAAWAAAWSAWAAAQLAAVDAARGAAWAAAEAAAEAAGDAAGDAERQWQIARLLDYAYGREKGITYA